MQRRLSTSVNNTQRQADSVLQRLSTNMEFCTVVVWSNEDRSAVRVCGQLTKWEIHWQCTVLAASTNRAMSERVQEGCMSLQAIDETRDLLSMHCPRDKYRDRGPSMMNVGWQKSDKNVLLTTEMFTTRTYCQNEYPGQVQVCGHFIKQ